MNLLRFETEAIKSGFSFIAGVDEAGRGPLAGPVVAGAVIFPLEEVKDFIKDSKKLTEKIREKAFEFIIDKAKAWSVGIINEKEIDKINIFNATIKAMKLAVVSLKLKPDLLLIDGNKRLPELKINQRCIVDGDDLSVSIAAASIIAKVTRDRIMRKYDTAFPEYGFTRHKGYGTKEHYSAIKKYGTCSIHRRSFNLGI